MLAHGANPYDAKEEPMMSAVYGGHLAVCSAMIAKAGVPSDEATQMEVLEEAIGSRHWAVLHFLLEQGFRPDAGLAEGWHAILGKLAEGAFQR